MTAIARFAALQRIREERVQELLRLIASTIDGLIVSGQGHCFGVPALGASVNGIREADRNLTQLARAIQPCDTTDDADAVLSLALTAAMHNLVSACDTVVAEGKLPAILHQLLKTHSRQVRDMLDSRKRRQLVAAAERVDAAEVRP